MDDETQDKIKETKKRISKAFRELRKQDIMARQNFWCCQTCGGYAMDTEKKKREGNGQEIKGYTFYHAQDNTRLKETGQTYLTHSDIETAKIIVQELMKAGLLVEWNFEEHTRIFISGLATRIR